MTEFQPNGFSDRGFADQLNIQTPEQVELRFPVAGIGSRFVAILLDMLFQFIVFIVLYFALILIAITGMARQMSKVMTPGGDMTTAGKWVVAAILFAIFLLTWGYYVLFEAYWKGQTPGKRIMSLRVIKDSGRQINLFESMARNLVRVVDYLPAFYFVGIITMLCNKRNKRLGDMVAGTLVIRDTPADDRPADVFLSSGNYFARPEEEYEERLPADAISRLDASDLQVIETFFARALDLDPQTRVSMGLRIASRVTTKMQLPMPEGNPERMLEDVAKALRGMGRRF